MGGRTFGGNLGTRKHILLVDDERQFRFSAAIVLRTAGFRVSEAANGLEAIQLALASEERRDPVALLITDIRMPGMSGVELIRRLKELGRCPPVLAITCLSDKGLREELASLGCAECVEKPFAPQELVEWVRRVLEAPRDNGPVGLVGSLPGPGDGNPASDPEA